MATQKQGTMVHWQSLSPILAIFRLAPENGSRFPGYVPGQYIALRRENCRLTLRITDPDGSVSYAPDVDENGVPRYGSVSHSYSIISCPSETLQHGWLEFYVVLEKGESQYPGRFTESLFRDQPDGDRRLTYFDRITGDFTLEKRAAGFSSVLLVGTGTGMAPFRSMIRQLHDEALAGKKVTCVTLFCTPTARSRSWPITRSCPTLKLRGPSTSPTSPQSAAPRQWI